MKTCAIFIPAYKCQDYIMDCVKSVMDQKKVDGWRYSLRIGVDGCPETAKVLTENRISFYWSKDNVGAYVMRNSLICLEKADIYVFFDADDVMLPTFLKTNIKCAELYGLILNKRITVDENLKNIKTSKASPGGYGGPMAFTHDILKLLGGFQPERVSSDTDFINRYRDLTHKKPHITDRGTCLRRFRSNSLTTDPKTGMGSEFREFTKQLLDRKRYIIRSRFFNTLIDCIMKNEDLNFLKEITAIKPVTTNLKLISNN